MAGSPGLATDKQSIGDSSSEENERDWACLKWLIKESMVIGEIEACRQDTGRAVIVAPSLAKWVVQSHDEANSEVKRFVELGIVILKWSGIGIVNFLLVENLIFILIRISAKIFSPEIEWIRLHEFWVALSGVFWTVHDHVVRSI